MKQRPDAPGKEENAIGVVDKDNQMPVSDAINEDVIIIEHCMSRLQVFQFPFQMPCFHM